MAGLIALKTSIIITPVAPTLQ